jgi:hypothetical protein
MLQWKAQLPDLVDAFLLLKSHGPCISQAEDSGRWHIEVINIESTYVLYSKCQIVNLLDNVARGLHPFTHLPSTPFSSVTLVLHGYIGASPDQPHLAFSIQLLAFYRQLRCVHPRLSLDAFAKCLNHFHSVSELCQYRCRKKPSEERIRSRTALILLTSLAMPTIATWRSYVKLIEGYPLNLDVRIASGL